MEVLAASEFFILFAELSHVTDTVTLRLRCNTVALYIVTVASLSSHCTTTVDRRIAHRYCHIAHRYRDIAHCYCRIAHRHIV